MKNGLVRSFSCALVAAMVLALATALPCSARELRTIGTLWVPEFEITAGLPVLSLSHLTETGPHGGIGLEPIRLTRRIDAGSPALFEAMTSGRRLATVQVRIQASRHQPQVDYTLGDAVIIEYKVAPLADAPGLVETISLRPARLRMDVTTARGTVGTCFDFGQRSAC